MYEDIKEKRTSDELGVFLEKCKKANMMPYIESYLKYKDATETTD
jgi:hypothetical protein